MRWDVLSKEDIDVKGIQLKDLYYKHATNNVDELNEKYHGKEHWCEDHF